MPGGADALEPFGSLLNATSKRICNKSRAILSRRLPNMHSRPSLVNTTRLSVAAACGGVQGAVTNLTDPVEWRSAQRDCSSGVPEICQRVVLYNCENLFFLISSCSLDSCLCLACSGMYIKLVNAPDQTSNASPFHDRIRVAICIADEALGLSRQVEVACSLGNCSPLYIRA